MTWDGVRPRVSEEASYRLLGSDERRYSTLQVGGQGSVGVNDNWRPAVGYPCNNNATTAGETHHFSLAAAAAAGPGRGQHSRLHRQYRTVNYMHELCSLSQKPGSAGENNCPQIFAIFWPRLTCGVTIVRLTESRRVLWLTRKNVSEFKGRLHDGHSLQRLK